MTFATDIEKTAGEPIIGIVIGEVGWGRYIGGDTPDVSTVRGRVITWEEARPLLDYKYSAGFGAPECHSITAWTENFVIFVAQYDGATRVETVPRNPVDHAPTMPGGG